MAREGRGHLQRRRVKPGSVSRTALVLRAPPPCPALPHLCRRTGWTAAAPRRPSSPPARSAAPPVFLLAAAASRPPLARHQQVAGGGGAASEPRLLKPGLGQPAAGSGAAAANENTGAARRSYAERRQLRVQQEEAFLEAPDSD